MDTREHNSLVNNLGSDGGDFSPDYSPVMTTEIFLKNDCQWWVDFKTPEGTPKEKEWGMSWGFEVEPTKEDVIFALNEHLSQIKKLSNRRQENYQTEVERIKLCLKVCQKESLSF